MPSRTEEQERYSPDNRLTLEQQAVMAARLMDREGVSERRAFQIIGETQAARQKILDERALASGGQPWVPPKLGVPPQPPLTR